MLLEEVLLEEEGMLQEVFGSGSLVRVHVKTPAHKVNQVANSRQFSFQNGQLLRRKE